jgi:glycosyltransferase involved in cell wall biosynthesis
LAAESPLLADKRVEVIPYGVPTATYHPEGRAGLRRAFGLRGTDRALLFVADRVSNRRKGFAVLQEALAGLRAPEGRRLVLFSVGRRAPEELAGHEHIALGPIENEELMAAIYSAADLFVAPSLQDNLPNTVLESLACGTPVVGSHTGGIPDMVRPGETGWLFETGNAEALRATLQEALAAPDLTGLRTRCREVAEREYSLELQAERYGKLYEEVGDEGRGTSDKGRGTSDERRGTRDEGQVTSDERQGIRDK